MTVPFMPDIAEALLVDDVFERVGAAGAVRLRVALECVGPWRVRMDVWDEDLGVVFSYVTPQSGSFDSRREAWESLRRTLAPALDKYRARIMVRALPDHVDVSE
jgi:hypothetical protein